MDSDDTELTRTELRDWFAGAINVDHEDESIDGLGPTTFAKAFGPQPKDPIEILWYWAMVEAKWRYMKADAMLAAREVKS